MEENCYNIPKEKFAFVQQDAELGDVKLTTKSTSYMQDAFSRFAKNRGSVVCFIIILLLALYAFFAPIFSPYSMSDKDGYYAYVTPKNLLFSRLGFWDGGRKLEVNSTTYQYLSAIPGAVMKSYGAVEKEVAKRKQTWYSLKVDSYARVGYVKMLLTSEEWERARSWEKENVRQLFYPIIDQDKVQFQPYRNDMNAWFQTDAKGLAVTDGEGKLKDIYLADPASPDGLAYYISRMKGSQYETRVLYSEWYYYKNGRQPSFLFGTDMSGYDIFTRLAHGARLSLALSLLVSAINLFLGIVTGALEGYYGGAFDLFFERVKDIIYEVPTQVTMVLFQLYLAKKLGPIVALFFAFIFYGWIGVSSMVRAQFYRFKGQDYVNASRTLGAGDFRLIFRHILPNAAGFIITASVLRIPSVIFSEANLTYLGIVNLDSDAMTSVGTMLNSAKDALASYPHTVFFPGAFISLLLVCFNEFGNGLRDAFNPTLRGAEE
ncbi:MAG: ABC transporter permease [Treponema sp.]|nr:ABC transporter permease [Treponema sp.]